MSFLVLDSTPNWDTLPRLSATIETLENFQDFDPAIRAAAITLYASEIATQYGWRQETAEFHLRAIALYAGLGGEG